MKLTKKYIVAVLITLIIIISIFIVIIILRNRSMNYSEHSYLPISLTTSTPIDHIINIPKDNFINLELFRATIDPREPFSNEKITIILNTKSNFTSKMVTPGSKYISNTDITLLFTTVGEGNPVKSESTPEYFSIDNKLGESLFRVSDSQNINTQHYLADLGLATKYNYFYTSTFDLSCSGQLKNGYCGTDYIFLKQKSNGDKVKLKIYCLTNESSLAAKCDQLISNLSFTTNFD